MSNTPFKKAFEDVSPDMYMGTRILANIKEKKQKHFPIKAVLCSIFAVVIVAGCFGGIQYKNQNTYVDRPFSVMMVDASDDVSITTEISENVIGIPNMQLVYNPEDQTVEGKDDVGFLVDAENVACVEYESLNGSFYCFDFKKMLYDQENRGFYSVVIPVPDIEVQGVLDYIDAQKFNPEIAGIKHYAQTHDLSEYFDSADVDFNDYWVYFERCSDIVGYEDEDGYAFFITESEKGESYYLNTMLSEDETLTLYNYDISEKTRSRYTDEEWTEQTNIGYSPDAAVMTLQENPNINMRELPSDEITITVHFNDGKKARKTIAVSFNDDGFAQFTCK